MTDPNAYRPPTAEPVAYASELARRAASALLSIPPVLLNERERMQYAHLADQLLAVAAQLQTEGL